jgi:hypothetical protein
MVVMLMLMLMVMVNECDVDGDGPMTDFFCIRSRGLLALMTHITHSHKIHHLHTIKHTDTQTYLRPVSFALALLVYLH